jgi:hypothetical protein
MWLLDVNLPNGLIRLLQSYEIPCGTTVRRGWRDLTNGALDEAAFREGFRVTAASRTGRAGASARSVASPEDSGGEGAPGPTDSSRRRPDHLLLRVTSS